MGHLQITWPLLSLWRQWCFLLERIPLSAQMRRQMQENCDNICRGIKEFVRVVNDEHFFWHHPVHLLRSSAIFCDRGIQRRYCRLYLGIKIYRQSIQIIFGAHVARSLLWTLCTSLSFAEIEFQFYTLTKTHKPNPVGSPTHIWLWEPNRTTLIILLITHFSLLLKFRNYTLKTQQIS